MIWQEVILVSSHSCSPQSAFHSEVKELQYINPSVALLCSPDSFCGFLPFWIKPLLFITDHKGQHDLVHYIWNITPVLKVRNSCLNHNLAHIHMHVHIFNSTKQHLPLHYALWCLLSWPIFFFFLMLFATHWWTMTLGLENTDLALPLTSGIVSHSLRTRNTDPQPHKNLWWKYFPWNFSGSAPSLYLGVCSVVPSSKRPVLTACLTIILLTPSIIFYPQSCFSFSSQHLTMALHKMSLLLSY